MTSRAIAGAALAMWSNEFQGGSIDAQIHLVAAGWSVSNYVAHSPQAQALQIQSVNHPRDWPIGKSIYHKGMTTDLVCAGGIKNNSWNGEFEGIDYTDMLLTGHCPDFGDSGGAVYSNFTAFGVILGRLRNVFGSCVWGIHSHTDNVEGALFVSINTD